MLLSTFPILYLHLFLAELEVNYCVCVQAYHQIDEVVRQAVAAQHFEECRSRNGIKCLNQIDRRDISLKVMLLSLSQCHEEIESTIDGPSLWTKSTLILWSVLLHDFFSRSTITHDRILDAISRRHMPRQFFGCPRSPFLGKRTSLTFSHSG